MLTLPEENVTPLLKLVLDQDFSLQAFEVDDPRHPILIN